MTEVQQGQVEAVLAQWTQRRRIGRATWVYMRKGLPPTWCGGGGRVRKVNNDSLGIATRDRGQKRA
jgi:hypothetical protein